MKPRDLFGVAIRAFAIWLLYMASYDFFVALVKTNAHIFSNVPAWEDLVFACYYLIAGLLLMVFADFIVKAVYGPAAARSIPIPVDLN
jgi:hypothetical protein